MQNRKRAKSKTIAAPPPVVTGRIGWLLACAFLAGNVFLAGYFLDSIPSPNPTSRALPVLTWYEEGRLAIDTYEKETIDKSFVNGHYYSDKAPLTTWIAIPFYGALRWLHLDQPATGKVRWQPIILVGDVLCGSIPFVLFLWLIFRSLVRIVPATDAILLCLLPVYGSFVYVYAGVYMSHILAGLLLCVSYGLLVRQRAPLLSGALLGLAVLAEFPIALAVVIWSIVMTRRNRRELMWFFLGGLPCVIALMLYNHAITGSIAKMPYDFEANTAFSTMRSAYGIRLPQPEAMWGLLFSTYRGLFFYAPALAIVAIAYLWTSGRRVIRDAWSTPLGIFSVSCVLLVSSYYMWWGGWSYGPRHLIPLAMLLFYEGIPALARTGRFRGWLYAASAAGIVMAWIAKSSTLYIMPEGVDNPVFDFSVPAFLQGKLRPDPILTQMFGVNPSVGVWVWIGCFALIIIGLVMLARLNPGHDRAPTRT